jgi:ABC-type cobalt transport system substrate-binding protein
MQKQGSKKNIIIIIVIVLLAVIVYFYFKGGEQPAGSDNLVQAVDPEFSQRSEKLLALLAQVQGIKIDSQFFKSPMYQSFVDHSVQIPEQEVGRDDPFAPIPGLIISKPETKTSK